MRAAGRGVINAATTYSGWLAMRDAACGPTLRKKEKGGAIGLRTYRAANDEILLY
jgi:hypothetical protein